MPIFSIGFVSHARPRIAVVAECAQAIIEWPVRAVWQRSNGMNCGCDQNACIPPGHVCAPAGDDLMVLFSVYDTDGDEYDLTGAGEIVFAVADYKGGAVRIVKRLSGDEIVISNNGYQFAVYLTGDDTIQPVRRKNYYEVRVTSDAGENKTVSQGVYDATRTIIKDIA